MIFSQFNYKSNFYTIIVHFEFIIFQSKQIKYKILLHIIMDTYKLVNPYIIGKFNTTYKVENGIDAAKQFWDDLSAHTTNNMPQLYITLQRAGDNKLFHYKINEKIAKSGSKIADYTISEVKSEVTDSHKKGFLSEISKLKAKIEKQAHKQAGGKRSSTKRDRYNKDDSSSDSSSSESESDEYFDFSRFKRLSQPISYWWYTPTLYNVAKLYYPTFNVPITPYMQVWVPMR